MRKFMYAGIILAAILICAGTASAANLIANGGFEVPVNTISWQIYNDGYPGLVWDVDDNIEYQTQSTLGLIPFEGSQYAELDPNYNVQISQVINAEAGTMYVISFAQSCRADDQQLPSLLGVYWGNTLLGQTSCSRSQALQWTTHSYSVTAAADEAVKITFADEGVSDSYGVLLDDVRVEKSVTPVPEFPAFAMPVALIIGMIGTVLFIRGSRDN